MLVKVLKKDLRPPIQCGEPYEIGVWHHCENFDTSEKECAPGFYVIPVSELIHYHNPQNDTKVLPVEVKGNSKIFSAAKRRYEYMKLDNPLTNEEIKTICREIEPELGYKLSEALYPVNPLLLPKATVNDEDIELLRKWSNIRDSVRKSVVDSVRDSVRDSVVDSAGNSAWDSAWDSVRKSVVDSVRDSVVDSAGDSVWESVWESILVYVGSLFPNIQKWEYIDHEIGKYPFQPAVDLWCRGFIPVFDGGKWKLLSGEKAEVVWTEPEIGWLRSQKKEGE